MRSLLEKLNTQGTELLMNPDRFREILVMLFTGVGEQPGELAQLFIAWFAAVLVAEKIYPRR